MIPHYSNSLVLALSENVIKQTSFPLHWKFSSVSYIVALEAKKRLQISHWVNVTVLCWVTVKYNMHVTII